MWKDIFKTNQHRGFGVEFRHGEIDCTISPSETAHAGDIFNERELPAKGNVFSENDQAAFAVSLLRLSIGADEKAAVEEIGLHAAIASDPRFYIIAAKHEPNLIFFDQIGYGRVNFLVVAVHVRHRGFRPH